MKQLLRPKGLIAGALALIVVLGVAAGVFALYGTHTTHAAAPQFKTHGVTVKPVYQHTAYTPGGKVLFGCQDNLAPLVCYGPNQIRTAYDISRVINSGINGAGTTIVIIDAFQSPTIRQDLQLFDQVWGLAFAHLNIIAPDGLTPFNPNDANQVGWSAEISLDVEWSHAIAPGATIDLVLAKDNQDANLLSVTNYAVQNNLGDVISQSFGEAETCMDPGLVQFQHQIFLNAAKKGITVFASSGDSGAAQPTCDGSSLFLSASTPASDPGVVAVGGTYLNADATSGRYIGESAWNENDVAQGASGGGFSTLYSRPSYQQGANHNATTRGVPDVSYDASVNGGVLVAWGVPFGVGNFFIFGGTSSGSPQWAAMLALVDSLFGRQGDIHRILYKGFGNPQVSALFYHDITVGNNSFGGVTGYNTTKGWDAVTGLGSFDLGNTIFGPVSANAATPHMWNHS